MKRRNDRVRRRTKIASSLILVIALGFFLPVPLFSGEGDAPMIPINVELRPMAHLSSGTEAKIVAITKDLIQRNLADLMVKSSRMDATASISKQSASTYVVEVLVMSLYKQSFNARMSRITFIYKNGQAKLQKVEPHFELDQGNPIER